MTSRCARSLLGRCRISAASTARSAQSSRGGGLVRRSTAISYRSTSSSAFVTPTNGRAGQASRRAERRSSRAGEETRLIIMPHGHASPVAPGHRNRPTFGTRHALATTSDSRALAAAGDPGQHPDRSVALGVAACGPDDAVAARLEQAAERAHASAAGTRPRRRSCPGRLSCQWTSACAPRGCSQQPMRNSPSPDSIGPVRCWTGSGRVQRPWPRDGCTTVPPRPRPSTS